MEEEWVFDLMTGQLIERAHKAGAERCWDGLTISFDVFGTKLVSAYGWEGEIKPGWWEEWLAYYKEHHYCEWADVMGLQICYKCEVELYQSDETGMYECPLCGPK